MCSLTKSQENYIKIIYELCSDGGGVRISDIAARLEVTKASASAAVKSLQKKELVCRCVERLVYLTDEGSKTAAEIANKFSIINGFLTTCLHIDPQIARADACALEHVLSPATLCALCGFINKEPCCDGCTVKAAPH